MGDSSDRLKISVTSLNYLIYNKIQRKVIDDGFVHKKMKDSYSNPSSLKICCLFGVISPPQMRHSLIYNYLREHAVLMLQNAYKHPCSKHLITIGKGTIFYRNSHKNTNKKFGKDPIFNRKLVRFGNNSYLCIARTRQASPLDLGRLPKPRTMLKCAGRFIICRS